MQRWRGVTRSPPRLAPLLAIFWLLLSGHYTALPLTLGLASVVLVVWITRRMAAVDGAGLRIGLPGRAPLYAGWLAGQVLLSALAVLRQVWSPRLAARPAVGWTSTEELTEVGTVAYANSITFTPGTLSLQVNDAGIEVHALREAELRQLGSGRMLERVRRLGPR